MKKARFDKLVTSARWSLRKLDSFRKVRYAAIQEYTGRLYGENGDQARVPLNMMELAITIYMQHLAARRPDLLVNTKLPSLKRLSLSFEHAMRDYTKAIKIERTFQRSVLNAMFAIGVVKTGDDKAVTLNWDEIQDDPFLSQFGDAEKKEGLTFTRPYAEAVDFDDFVVDMGSRTIEEARFIGHRYRILKDELADGLSESGRRRLKSDIAEFGDTERVEEIGRGGEREPEPFDEMVECYEIYLPYERSVVTLQLDGERELEEREYTGPDGGNYHTLSFHEVPNNVMPLPPVSLWLHLHRLGNELMNKLGEQANRQKTIPLYGDRAAEAARIHEAPDGHAIKADPGDVVEKSFGGPNQGNFGFLLKVQDWFSYFAGNLDLLGGLGPQSSTLGQDEILAGSASKRIMDMQTRVMVHYEEVLKSLGWYVYYDQMYDPPLSRQIAPGIQEHMSFSPEDRDIGDILAFDFEIVPFSMTHEPPSVRAQKLMQIVQGVYLPMAQQAAQQGVALDMKKLFAQLARLQNMEDVLPEILTYTDPRKADQGGGDRAGMSPVTRRENVRINRPGATEAGKRDVLARQLMGVGTQQSERDSLGAGSY